MHSNAKRRQPLDQIGEHQRRCRLIREEEAVDKDNAHAPASGLSNFANGNASACGRSKISLMI
jgi:hypothetical protein